MLTDFAFFVNEAEGKKSRVFVPGKPFQPLLVFACKSRGLSFRGIHL